MTRYYVISNSFMKHLVNQKLQLEQDIDAIINSVDEIKSKYKNIISEMDACTVENYLHNMYQRINLSDFIDRDNLICIGTLIDKIFIWYIKPSELVDYMKNDSMIIDDDWDIRDSLPHDLSWFNGYVLENVLHDLSYVINDNKI